VGVLEVEVRLEVFCIIDGIVLAGDDVIQALALLVTLECGLVELVVDGLVLLVIDEFMQDGSVLDGLLLVVVAFEELLFRSGEIDLFLELVLVVLLLVVGLRLWLEIEEV
jgi:hypothetical protein